MTVYNQVSASDPIRQGDVFANIPLLGEDFHVEQIPFILEAEHRVEIGTWTSPPRSSQASVSIRPAWGIVATQDCDAAHSLRISFFEVVPFLEAFKQDPPRKASEAAVWWVDAVTTKTQALAKCFYLPPDTQRGISQRMAASFNRVFALSRSAVVSLLPNRLCTLNDEAYQHYRESMSRFFQRYAYDEWYPLTKSEVEVYETRRKVSVKRRPYQE